MRFQPTQSPQEKAEAFLQVAAEFQLGDLATESNHPKTRELSVLAQENLHRAVEVLREVDLDALAMFAERLSSLTKLNQAIRQTLAHGNRIYLCGCGATGRLSLSLEYLWRQTWRGSAREDQVRSFMAGGDTALVHALEGFEDYPAFGERQLKEAGFQPGDLLISCTEGGETPFVIGATESAAASSGPKPFFLYCNPDEILSRKVERSRRVLENPRIEKINLYVGPMALAGSTRMQASTVLMMAVGLGLFFENPSQMQAAFEDYRDHFATLDLSDLPNFIAAEAKVYQQGGHLLYHAEDLAIAVFTDTTERAPTFSLPAFDNQKFPTGKHSLSYVVIDSARSASESWLKLLGRSARPLNWGAEYPKTNDDYLAGFDFGPQGEAYRCRTIPGTHAHFRIEFRGQDLCWSLQDLQAEIPADVGHPLFGHLLLKQLLNIHSTLIMGRLGRYRLNFMTWVVPTNGKLVDRATRYVQWLLAEEKVKGISYEEIVRELFRQEAELKVGESVVLKTAAALAGKIHGL